MAISKLGFLGAGTVARHHAIAARELGAEVVAACAKRPQSPNWERFLDAAPDARRLSSPEDVLEDAQVEAVIACLSWDVMPDWTARLLACPKPVLLEKPIALAAEAAQAAVAAPDARLENKLIGYNRRFYEPVARLRWRLGKGGLKAVDAVISEPIENHVERLGDEIVAHLIPFSSAHTLDLILHLFGPLAVVRIAAHPEHGAAAPFVSYNGLLETAAGVPVSLALNAYDPSPAGVRCRFDDGTTWHLSPLEVLMVYQGTEVRQPTPEYNIRRYTPKVVNQYMVDTAMKPGFAAQMAAFLSGSYGPGATPEEAVAVLDLIEAIHDAARRGQMGT